MNRNIIPSVSAALLLLMSCGEPAETAESHTPVTVIIPEPQDITSTVRSACRLESGSEAIITALNPGRILEVSVSEGDEVHEGQILVELSGDQQYRSAVFASSAQLTAARAFAANAEADLQRSERLRADGAISEQEYEMSVSRSAASSASVRQALAGCESASSMAESGRILAPFSGRVTRVWAREGDLSAGPLVSIADSGILKSEVLIADRHLQYLADGLPVVFATSHYPGEFFTGEVISFSSSVDPVSGLVSVIIQFHDDSGRLRSGMSGTATLGLQIRENAVVLPLGVLLHEDDFTWEAVLVVNNTAEIVPIETGIRSGTSIEITEGVQAGDSVIHLGHHLVTDGSSVRVVR